MATANGGRRTESAALGALIAAFLLELSRPAPSRGRWRFSYSAILSTAAFAVAFATLYLTLLRGPQLTVKIGPVASISYAPDHNLVVAIPVMLNNIGGRPGLIRWMKLEGFDRTSRKHLEFYATGYANIAENGSKTLAQYATPETLAAGASAAHEVVFQTIPVVGSAYPWRAGDAYAFTLFFADRNGRWAHADDFDIVMSGNDVRRVESEPNCESDVATSQSGVPAPMWSHNEVCSKNDARTQAQEPPAMKS